MPKLNASDFLRLTEKANTLAFVDIEATGLRADYNSALVISIKPYDSQAYSLVIKQPGNDQGIVRAAKRELEQYDCWVTFYGKGYDIPFLNTRLLKWGSGPIEQRHHVDLYFTLKYNLLLTRKGQGALLRFLETPEQKMDMAPEDWNNVIADPKKALPKMVKRCESDAVGLQGLYEKTKHLIKEIKRGGI